MRYCLNGVAGLCALVACASAMGADEVITVNTLEDVVDVAPSAQVGDLPGPDGNVSFREAVTAVNNTPGAQTVKFAIPPSEWWLINGVALLRLEDGAFFINDDDTVLDFASQAEFSGDTNASGREVGIYGLEPNGWGTGAIFINANNCTVIGLGPVMQRGYGLDIRGDNNRVIGSVITGAIHSAVQITGGFEGPPAMGNFIGGTGPGEGNTLSGGGSGVRIAAPAENNVVIGNQISGGDFGVWLIGSPYSTTVNNNRIGGAAPGERNVISGAGSFGTEGFPSGAQVQVEYGIDNVIEGNWIGLDATGQAAASPQRGPAGVRVHNSNGTIIRDNVISGIRVVGVNHYAGQVFGDGVAVRGASDGTIVSGNQFGVDADGEDPVPSLRNVMVTVLTGNEVPTNTLIGGEVEGEGNVIAFAETDGVRVASVVQGARIVGNSIRSNGALGIELVAGSMFGPTPNDPGDADTGANRLQNFPTLTSAEGNGSSITISGMLDSLPNQAFRVEFFANASCDPSGFGEGEEFLGAATVVTDADGMATFSETFAANVEDGAAITSTATRESAGDTSEFSACIGAEIGAALLGDLNADGRVDFDDLNMVLSQFGQTGPGMSADANHDERVDFDDLNMVLSHFGEEA